MNEQEQLQLIEDVCLSVCWHLHECRTGKLPEYEGLILIKQELQKLDCITTTPEEREYYLLTAPHFGPSAYLEKMEGKWVVTVDGNHVTGSYTFAKTALNEYITQCESDDFVIDFVAGEEEDKCSYGLNNYATYVQKCFECYVLGKGL